jgi:methionine-rich copper-binding protein CopC
MSMRLPRIYLLSAPSIALAVVLSGCSNSITMSSGAAPTVAALGEQANGFAPNRALYVQFNEAMNPATINDQTVTVKDSGGTAMAGKVTYDANFDVAAFQPDPALQGSTSYTLTVSTAATSAQGVPLASAYTDQFTTRAAMDSSPIYVKSVTPAANATCVSASTPITVTFSEGAEVSTLNANDIVITGPGSMPIAAAMSYDAATGTVTLTPNAKLPSGTITVTVRNVADAAGVAMSSAYAWSFSTMCGGGGGGGNATTQYQASLVDGHSALHGQVTVDTKGNTTIQLTGATANAHYFSQFCPAVWPASPNPNMPCFAIADFHTDASGNASDTVLFPRSGDWAGDFSVGLNSVSNYTYATNVLANVSSETYMGTLVPETQTNGGALVGQSSPQDPLTSGMVTYSNGALKFTLTGAAPNEKYTGVQSETTYLDGSGSYSVGTFSTDSNGDGTLSTTLSDTGGDIFQAGSNAGAGFIAGFSIPHP